MFKYTFIINNKDQILFKTSLNSLFDAYLKILSLKNF